MMTPYLIFLVFLAIFIWRRASSVPTFLVRFAIASIGFLILYVVAFFAFTLVSGTFQLREDGESGESSRSQRPGLTRAFNPRMKALMYCQEHRKSPLMRPTI